MHLDVFNLVYRFTNFTLYVVNSEKAKNVLYFGMEEVLTIGALGRSPLTINSGVEIGALTVVAVGEDDEWRPVDGSTPEGPSSPDGPTQNHP